MIKNFISGFNVELIRWETIPWRVSWWIWYNGRNGSRDEFSVGRLCPKNSKGFLAIVSSLSGNRQSNNAGSELQNYAVFKSPVSLCMEYRTIKRYDQGLHIWIQYHIWIHVGCGLAVVLRAELRLDVELNFQQGVVTQKIAQVVGRMSISCTGIERGTAGSEISLCRH